MSDRRWWCALVAEPSPLRATCTGTRRPRPSCATLAQDRQPGSLDATISSWWLTEEDEFAVFCAADTFNTFQSGFTAGWADSHRP